MESCVNSVGVDVNEASAALLRFVSGLDHLKAHQLVQWRNDHGPFRSRADLMQVPGMDAATFMRAAGFLRVYNGDHPFDETWLHPEQYPLAERILSHLGLAVADWRDPEKRRQAQEKLPTLPLDELANAWQVSRQAFQDVINELTHPGRDPRWERPGPTLRKKVLRFEDLQPGMELRGTVVNVVDFGAFVDVGLRDSCLVHISELANRYIRSPYELVSVGDVVTTWVLKVDRDKRRVSLTMMPPGTPRTRPKQPVAAKPAEAKERTEARPAKPPARRLRRRTGKPRAPKPAVVAPRASNAAETPSAAGTASPPASVSSPTQGPAPPTAPEKVGRGRASAQDRVTATCFRASTQEISGATLVTRGTQRSGTFAHFCRAQSVLRGQKTKTAREGEHKARERLGTTSASGPLIEKLVWPLRPRSAIVSSRPYPIGWPNGNGRSPVKLTWNRDDL